MEIMFNEESGEFSITGMYFPEMNDLLCRTLYAGMKASKERFKKQVKEVYTNREDTYWNEWDIRSSKKTIRMEEELIAKIQDKFNELYHRD